MASEEPTKSGKPPPGKPSGKKTKKLSQKEQSERFKQTAREVQADESGEAFERAVEKVLPAKPK